MRSTLLLSAALILAGPVFSQNAGELDPDFNSTGYHITDFGFQDNLTDVKVQADQKILSCGTALSAAFAGRLIVMRHLPDGTPDTGFGDNGAVMIESFTESYAYEMQVLSDGKILVAGSAANPSYIFSALVMRLNQDGSLDTSFGADGMAVINFSGTDHFAYGMRVQTNGKILIAGSAMDANFNNQPVVIRLNEDGSVDEEFGFAGMAAMTVEQNDNRFNALDIQSDGKIVAAGHFANPVTQDGQIDNDLLIVRFNEDGTLDSSFGGDGIVTDAVSASYSDDLFKVVATDNSIIVAGYTTLPDFSFDAIVLEYQDNGERNMSFGSNGVVQLDLAVQDVYLGLVLQSDGKIVASGTSGGFFFDNRDLLVTRLNADGSFDTGFGTGGNALTEVLGWFDEANSVALQDDGKIVIAGKVNNGSQNDACVARFMGLSTPDGIAELNGSGLSLFPNPVEAGHLLTLTGPTSLKHADLTDTSGRLILTLPVRSDNGQYYLSIPPFITEGVYLIRTGTLLSRLVIY